MSSKRAQRHLVSATVSLLALTTALLAFPATAQTATQATPPQSVTAVDPATGKPVVKAPPAPRRADGQQSTTSPDTTVVTVTATAPQVVHKVDRDVYDVKQDPTSATGSAADILNNVPAVTVDPDGTVQLRGNSNVQVYVNGKKSTQMSGDNRGFTLQSMSGDDVDSVEVISNPSSEFGADTSGGIINIVMKRGRAIKPQTGYNLVLGDQGRANVNFRTGATLGKLTLNMSGSLNHGAGGDGGGLGGRGGRGGGFGPKSKSFRDTFRLDPVTGAVLREDQQTSVSKSDNRSSSATINDQYNLSDSDTLEGNFNYNANHSIGTSSSQITSYDGNHTLTGSRASLQNSARDSENIQVNLAYDHRGQIGSSEDFKMQVSHSLSLNGNESQTHNIFAGSTIPDTYQAQAGKTKDYIDEFSGDWVHPFAEKDDSSQQIKTGWDLQHTISDIYSYSSVTLNQPVQSPASPCVSAVSQYNVVQTLSAGYFIYEYKYKKLSTQLGLRVENLHQTMESSNPVTNVTPTQGKYDNLFYSPNATLLYNFSEKQRLRFSFTEKLRRPSGRELNPLVVISEDGLSARSGNANLKPEKTDKFELAYSRDIVPGTSLTVTPHYDSTTNSINNITTYLPGQPNVLLYTYDNSGTRKQSGLDMSLFGMTPGRKLNFNLSGTFNYTTTDSTDPTTHLPIRYSGPSSSANGRISYKVTPKDTFSAGFNYSGKQTGFQSYSTQVVRLNTSYIRQIIPSKLIMTVNASNFMVGPISKRVNETSTNRSYGYTFDPGASFMVSLRYTFGEVRAMRGDGQGGFRQRGDGQGGGRFGGGGLPGGGPGGGF